MKTKTSNLTGNALDWAVAKCEGYEFHDAFVINGDPPQVWLECNKTLRWLALRFYNPSTNWSRGGPIIERELLLVGPDSDRRVGFKALNMRTLGQTYKQYGSTPLIAAMRCYVASKLGDEVEIPEELCNETR